MCSFIIQERFIPADEVKERQKNHEMFKIEAVEISGVFTVPSEYISIQVSLSVLFHKIKSDCPVCSCNHLHLK